MPLEQVIVNTRRGTVQRHDRRRPRREYVTVSEAPSLVILVPGRLGQRVCGKPRSTLLMPGSGQREVTTLPRV